MTNIKISIFNDSKALTDAQVGEIVPALQTQVTQHFAPIWGTDATLTFIPKGHQPAPGSWWLTFLDTSDQANALGYHDLTSEGLPIGKVFVQSDLDNHLSWSVTASHELLEMLADPDVNLTTFVQTSATAGTLYAYEVCDAVEDDQFAYAIDGTTVSDFVYPSYFEPGTSAATQHVKYDHCGKLSKPVPVLLPGGYIGEFSIPNGSGWTQKTAATEGQPHRGHLRIPVKGSRAERRGRKANWRPADPRFVRM